MQQRLWLPSLIHLLHTLLELIRDHKEGDAYPAGGLASAHSGPVAFVRDGLYLLHKEGHYALGQSPLALTWKDAACSRFLLDTDLNGNTLSQQVLSQCSLNRACCERHW